MAAEKALAIVVRATPFGDSSAVVTVFTREFGKLRALAKGAWRPKGAFDAALDLLSICQVLVLRKFTGGLDLLTEASLEHRFRVGDSVAAFHGGMQVAELLDALTAEGDPHPELFDVAHSTLRILSAAGPSVADAGAPRLSEKHVHALLVQTELAVLRHVGHAPGLVRCAECAGPVPPAHRVSFGMLDGGVLCGGCRRGKRAVVSMSSDCLAALRLFAGAPDAWRTVSLPEPVAGEVRAVMNTLLCHLLGRRPLVAPLLQPRFRPRSFRPS